MAELRIICRLLFSLGLFVFVASQDPGTDPCAGNQCAEGSTCFPPSAGMDGGLDYFCACPPGLTGMYCEQTDPGTTDPCASNPCSGDATCFPNLAMSDGYECNDLSADPCAENQCAEGSTCFPPSAGMDGGLDYFCACPLGLTGMYCEQTDPGATDPCASNPCSGDATCYSSTAMNGGYECIDPNYDPCSSNPCLNEGSCMLTATGLYTCSCVQGYYGHECEKDELKIEAECAELDHMVEGQIKSLQEWCEPSSSASTNQEPFSVRVYGMKPTELYNFEFVIWYKDQETVAAELEVQGAGGDDITTQVAGMTFSSPDPTTEDGRIVCYNEDALLSMKITSMSDPTKTYETEKHRVTSLCDFKDADLMVSSSATLGTITSSNNGTKTLGEKLAESGITVTFNVGKVAGTSDLPLLGNDASFYIAAFLTKRHVPLLEDCTEDNVPELTYPDTILWFKKFKALDELSGISDDLKEVGILAENRCGEHNLVILVDPIFTIPVRKRCNNYIVIPFILEGPGCDKTIPEEPRCAVIANPFDNGRETALTYHHHQNLDIGGSEKPDNKMFKFDNFATWKQEMSHETDHLKQLGYKANNVWYGRLKLLELDIRSSIEEGLLSCDQSEEEARQSVTAMEELDPSEDDTFPSNLGTILEDFDTVLDKVQQLKDGSVTAAALAALKDEVREILEDMPSPENTATYDMIEKVMYWTKRAGYIALANITQAKLDESIDSLKMKSRYNLCKVGDLMMRLRYMKKYITMMEEWMSGMTQTGTSTGTAGSGEPDPMQLNFAYQGLIENITRQMVMLNQFFPGASFETCLDKIFKRTVSFVTGGLNDDSWLFDNCRRRASNCLMKVKDFCSNHDDNCAFTTPLKDDKDYCAMRHFKEKIEIENKILGIHDIREMLTEINKAEEDGHQSDDSSGHDSSGYDSSGYDSSGYDSSGSGQNYNGGMPDMGEDMYEDEKGEGCSGEDPVSPKNGPVNLFKWTDDKILLRGVPRPNEGDVCWNKVAVCTCQDCGTATGTSAGKRRKKK